MSFDLVCRRCGNPAVFLLIDKKLGKPREIPLCRVCARKFAPNALEPDEAAPNSIDWTKLEAQIDALLSARYGESRAESVHEPCPICGQDFDGFREAGRLGCPHDYVVFERHLRPIIGRTHGATRHVGKRPKRNRLPTGERLVLRARLRQAIAQENYEVAAALRDRLRAQDPTP